MSHFHLKYISKTGNARTNPKALFYSEMEALDAAGLANATRGEEEGFYSIQPCRRRVCEEPWEEADATRVEGAPGRRRTRSRMLN